MTGSEQLAEEVVDTLPMTEDGIEMPDDLVGFTGQLKVDWPGDTIDSIRLNVTGDGIPEVCDWICRGEMPDSTSGADIPTGHLRMNGDLYKIEDER